MKKLAIIILCVILLSASLFGCDQAENSKADMSENGFEANSESPLEQSEEVSEGVSVEVSELSFTIVDKRDTAVGFDDALELFYSDEEYDYLFPSLPESEYIIVEYSDGTTQNIKEALSDGKVTIEDFDKLNIFYFKQSKATGEYEPINGE